MRRAARTDANHARVVKALLDAGAFCQSLAAVGVGCPDILVGFRGETFLIEVKNPEAPPSDRVLTDAQKKFHRLWRGRPIAVVETPDEALRVIGALPPIVATATAS